MVKLLDLSAPPEQRKEAAGRKRMWLAAASGESTSRYGIDTEITSSTPYDLLSRLLVPASSVGHDGACPDHNYACSSLPDR